MRPILAVIILLLPLAALAQDGSWQAMGGDDIRTGLTERKLQYGSATQVFYASGRTLYDAGRPSWGYWRIEGDAYCSQWPPSDLWACYTMERKGDRLRFVGAQGDITEGRYVD